MKKIFRIIKLQKYRITKIKDFPDSVALGMAWGAAVSFTPLLGFHLIICYLGTWLMRGNLIAATVGTIIGNPRTFPFIFYLDYKIGTTIFLSKIAISSTVSIATPVLPISPLTLLWSES